MSTLKEYYRTEMDKYFHECSKQTMLAARLTGSIQAFLKYSSLTAAEKKILADGVLAAYESVNASLGSSKELFEAFSEKKDWDSKGF